MPQIKQLTVFLSQRASYTGDPQLLASVGGRADVADVYRVSRADVVKHGMGPEPRDPAELHLGKGARDIYIPDLRLGSSIIPGEPVETIKVRKRDFR